MKVSLNGFNEQVATFVTSGTVVANNFLKMDTNNTVTKCAATNKICGQALSVKDGYAAVKLSGYISTKYSGSTAPTVGYCNLVADGNDGVTVSASGREYLVVEVDSLSKTIGFIL